MRKTPKSIDSHTLRMTVRLLRDDHESNHRIDIRPRSRDSICPRFAKSFAPKRKRAQCDPKRDAGDPQKRGRREDRVRAAPAVPCAKVANKSAHEHTGSGEEVRPSLRNGFNSLFRALPGETRACLSPSSPGSVNLSGI